MRSHKFIEWLGFAYPIVFESGYDEFPYYCGGTCFAVTLAERLFIVTATHCLTGHEGDPCIIGPDGQAFPIRQTFPIHCDDDDNDWADITCISTDEREFWPSVGPFHTLNLDRVIERSITADHRSFLALKGYPASHTELAPPKIIRRPTFHLGLYGGPTDARHCHFFNVIHPLIGDPNGLSGTPVLKIDYAPDRGIFPTPLGVVIRGGPETQFLRFVGINIVVKALLQLSREL